MVTEKKPPATPKVKKPPKPRRPRKQAASIIRNGLTTSEILFVDAYIANGSNGAAAARSIGFSDKRANVQAHEMLNREHVRDELNRRMKEISKATNVDAERVLRETFNILTADVNDLVEYRRTCCRHCWGIDFGYQRTRRERRDEYAKWETKQRKNARKMPSQQEEIEPFDEMGGIGYHARKDPNPDCEECFGEGVGSTHFKDTRKLSPSALALYAGVKVTKDGAQMLLLDKAEAANKLFKHFGLYKEDNNQKNEGLAEMIKLIQAKKSKLPIKG